MPVQDIPLGSTVTKKTGEKEYTLRDDIKIWGSTQEQTENLRELKADDGTRFLISKNGDISIISGETEMLWHVDNQTLYNFLYQKVK